MSTTTLQGSVVNSPEDMKRAITANLTLSPYSPGRSLAVNLALWIKDQSFDTLVRLVLAGGAE